MNWKRYEAINNIKTTTNRRQFKQNIKKENENIKW